MFYAATTRLPMLQPIMHSIMGRSCKCALKQYQLSCKSSLKTRPRLTLACSYPLTGLLEAIQALRLMEFPCGGGCIGQASFTRMGHGLLIQRGSRLGVGTNNASESLGLAAALKTTLHYYCWLVERVSTLATHSVRDQNSECFNS